MTPGGLERARALIDARFADPLDVPALARSAGLSPAHFSREFRKAFGASPHEYLVARRLERAAELLRTTDLAVEPVCRAVGLRSVGSFTTSFGCRFGVAPAAYRAAAAARPDAARGGAARGRAARGRAARDRAAPGAGRADAPGP